jgi:hypothetical protein
MNMKLFLLSALLFAAVFADSVPNDEDQVYWDNWATNNNAATPDDTPGWGTATDADCTGEFDEDTYVVLDGDSE